MYGWHLNTQQFTQVRISFPERGIFLCSVSTWIEEDERIFVLLWCTRRINESVLYKRATIQFVKSWNDFAIRLDQVESASLIVAHTMTSIRVINLICIRHRTLHCILHLVHIQCTIDNYPIGIEYNISMENMLDKNKSLLQFKVKYKVECIEQLH